MTKSVERIALAGASLGTARHLLVHRYRPGKPATEPRKVYIQASLHADELPGMMAVHHLLQQLDAADRADGIRQEIVVVPVANPVGLAQVINGYHAGRADLSGNGNFNRNWPDLFAGLEDRVAGRLGADAAANKAAIRAAIAEDLAERNILGEADQLKLTLTRLAGDADMVLDVHCDDDSLMHLYMPADNWADYQDLAAELGAVACMTSSDSGSFCFDETFALPWNKLRSAVGDKFPIPAAPFVTTLELRGQPDVFDDLGTADAKAIYRFLQRHGVLAGDPGPAPRLLCTATPLNAADVPLSPGSGLLAYKRNLGEVVKKGDLLAELIDPLAEDLSKARQPIFAANDGLILSRRQHKLVKAGDYINMIVGTEVLAHRSAKLMTD
ncbi:MAG TPA: succinylglutamate desuccinylase/aspartoacylase family protein [Dongiaceae bacterium]|nr:succinylglutamate desuccinylase/aspartoacylase family protein [Dongiaceae bacterium]